MTKTVTLPMEWREDVNGVCDDLYMGPVLIGWIMFDRSGRYIVTPEFHTALERYYPTREAAMAALEAAVLALGVQNA